ncbi:hypothetical protein [Streptomyces sp. NPDC094468]|uniref:hypothetical protein n=1 Tax=Streptomyces sp. NPDC094468 TaxID=3366066 RepID=UPI00382AA766
MSDESDREIQNLGSLLLMVYMQFRTVCGLLPIPITLPDFEDDVLRGQEMTESVAQVTRLIEDEPADEFIQSGIWIAAVHWVSASHLFARYSAQPDEVVALGVRSNAVLAHDTLHAVEDLLLVEREDE